MGSNSKILQHIWILIYVVICVVRCWDLTLDPPAYNRAGINATDEPYYCISAVNEALMDEDRVIEELIARDGDMLFQHNFALTYVSLKVFGLNYWGLRLPAAILGCLSLLLLFLTVRKQEDLGRSSHILILLFLGFEFTFFIFSRYQTPQLYSLFWISLILFVFSAVKNPRWRISSTAFLIATAVIWVYPYMAFVALGFGAYVIVETLIERNIRHLSFAALGSFAALIFISLAFAIQGSTLLDYFDLLTGVNEVRDETNSSFDITMAVKGILGLVYNFTFMYSPILLVPLVAIPFLFIGYKRLKPLLRLGVWVMVFAVLQAIVIDSYPFKKWVILFPVLFVLLFESIRLFTKRGDVISSWVKMPAIGISMLLVFMNQRVNFSKAYWSGFAQDYAIEMPSMIWPIWSVFVFLTFVGILIFTRLKLKPLGVNWILVLLILSSTPFMIRYFTSSQSSFQEQLSAFDSIVDDELIIGDFAHAYAFYTDGLISHNPYNVSYGTLSQERVDSVIKSREAYFYIQKDLNQSVSDSLLLLNDRELLLQAGSTLKLYSTK